MRSTETSEGRRRGGCDLDFGGRGELVRWKLHVPFVGIKPLPLRSLKDLQGTQVPVLGRRCWGQHPSSARSGRAACVPRPKLCFLFDRCGGQERECWHRTLSQRPQTCPALCRRSWFQGPTNEVPVLRLPRAHVGARTGGSGERKTRDMFSQTCLWRKAVKESNRTVIKTARKALISLSS